MKGKSRSGKVLLIGAVVALLAAGCGPTTPTAQGGGTGRIAFACADEDDDWRICSIYTDGSGFEALIDITSVGVEILSWSPDGTRLAFLTVERNLYVANADGAGASILSTDVGETWPAWSPDGTRLALECDDGYLCVAAVDGSGLTRLTAEGPYGTVSWSPDGSRIAFASWANRNLDILVANADGSGHVNLTSNWDADASVPAWSPDGTRIAFFAGDWGWGSENDNLYIVNADGSGLIQLTDDPGEEYYPTWQP